MKPGDIRRTLWLFMSLGHLTEETRDILAEGLREEDEPLPAKKRTQLSETLSHLGNVREGFAVSLRTSTISGWQELRDLVSAIMFNWAQFEQEEGVSLIQGQEVEIPRRQLLAFAHAYVALGMMPRLPASEVTFPKGRRTYADIPVPRSPGDLLTRIEEMEGVIWEAVVHPIAQIEHDPFRRTYGFFDAGTWLVSSHLGRFFRDQE